MLRRGINLVSVLLIILLVLQCFSVNVYATEINSYEDDFDTIAYSVISGINDAPINSAEHFKNCCSEKYDFTSIKGDVRLTSDNRLIMCHDKGFTLNSKGRIISYNSSNMIDIHNLTYRQCSNLQYAKQYNGRYVKVCDFETYLKICAQNNKKAFITIRDEYASETVSVMMKLIYKYNMQSKCIINSFSLDCLKTVRKYDNSMPLSWVISKNSLSKYIIDEAANLNNCILTLFNFPTSMYGGLESFENYLDLINYAQTKKIKLYTAVLESISYIDELRKLGISGAQISSLDTVNIPAYTTSVDFTAVYDYKFYVNKYPDIKSAFGNNRLAAFKHFINYGMKEGRQAKENFDVISYKNRYVDLRRAFRNDYTKYYYHFINCGKEEKRLATSTKKIENPITIFDGVDYSAVYNFDYYLKANPDIKILYELDDISALEHFVKYGMKEGRRAKEEFDVRSYKCKYYDLRCLFGNDLKKYYLHYIKYGKAEGRKATGIKKIEKPITIFDGLDYSAVYSFDYYLKANPDVKRLYEFDDVSALEHFVSNGMKEGRRAKEEFDVRSYKSKYYDLRCSFGNDLKKYYLHYIRYGKAEGRIATGVNKIEKPITILDGVDYSAVYDFDYYLKANPDIKRLYEFDDVSALEHFVKYGMKEGRQAKEIFNVFAYKNNYLDLRNVYGENNINYYLHYMKYGVSEKRNGKATTLYEGKDYKSVFDAKYYADHNVDLKKKFGDNETLLFFHFIRYGMKEGRQASKEFNVKFYQKKYKDLQNVFGNNLRSYYDHYVLFGKKEGRIASE